MMRFVFALLIPGCLASAADAAENQNPSLFFTPDEVVAVQTQIGKAPRLFAETGDVHLGAVFYYAPDNWVLWLQGMKWTPATQNADIQVTDVKPDEVHLRLTTLGGKALEVSLKPHQTFQLSTGRVVEGSAAVSARALSK